MKKATGEPGWTWRRAIIFPVVIYACWQLRLLIDAPDTRVNERLADGWMILIAVLVLGYTGFATVQDVAAIWRTGTGLPYAPQNPNIGNSLSAPGITDAPGPHLQP
jgi:D-alanyl-lipoteichoic acid acyltransferase DltB (MBOAT superfamily)